MNHSIKVRAFLVFCSVGLIPIALGYGAAPSITLDAMFGITVDTTNLTHIMRAVMGLYFAMVALWLAGATKPALAGPALIACAVFMLGLAAGRLLSFALDGLPHWLLRCTRSWRLCSEPSPSLFTAQSRRHRPGLQARAFFVGRR